MLRYAKVRDVKDIERGTELSAGIDFYIPNDWNKKMFKTIKPGERVLIPSGIHIDMIGSGLEDYALIFFNKSGVGSKKGLDILACVVDADYQGEIHINVVNTGAVAEKIFPGEKIVQGILLPVKYDMPVQLGLDDLYQTETERGAGGFGSTDA